MLTFASMPPGKATGARVNARVQKKIWDLHMDGFSISAIARNCGMGRNTVAAVLLKLKNSDGEHWMSKATADRDLREATIPSQLSAEAARALEDFAFFRQRYFGRIATPWQTDAALFVQALLETPEKEYAVMNAPPGSGKSTLFTHDIPAWLACRNRRIRCLIGSRTFRQAKWYTGRLRRSFERVEILPPDDEEVAAGRAVAPQASLVQDFGRFRPLTQFTTDVWKAEEFVIAQPRDILTAEKEASFAAYGMDSGFLGGRFKLVIWDDLVDRKNIRNAEVLENLKETYENEAESRVEPGGLLILQGQRMAPNDLYRHALDQKAGELDEDEEGGPLGEDLRPAKYHHIVYRAHYEENCRGKETHGKGAPYWAPKASPEGEALRALFGWEAGCLLDPVRITWRELRTIRANREEKFRILYQQEDVDPANVLVPKLWIDGGKDPETGEEFPGCWDKDRGLAQIPKGLTMPLHSIVTADPSPTKFWAVEWWGYHPDTEQRFLLDLVKMAMDAPDFLDWDYNRGEFTGLLEEWWLRANDKGHPFRWVIVEANAAQRFLLQYDHVRRWCALRQVTIIPHQTHRNKSDEDFGVQSIAPHYRFGRVRLPGSQSTNRGGDGARLASMKLVDEVTRYPDTSTTDCTMAHWFLEWNLPRLIPRTVAPRTARRPSWAKSRPVLHVVKEAAS